MDGIGASRTHGRTYTIGVLSPVIGGHYFGRLLAGIARAVRTDGHRVVAVQTYPADLEREQFPARPPERTTVGLDLLDGVIAITSAVDRTTLDRLERAGTPLVLVSERHDGLEVPVVTPDNAGGVRAAVEHLVGHGHRRIAFLGSLLQHDVVERHEAYLATLAAHGIDADPRWVYRTADNQEASGARAARAALDLGLPTTATVAATDRNATGFSAGLRARGLVLPRDQAVVGFDHSEGGARARPRLASVDPHHDRVGELAATLLLARLRGEPVASGQHVSESTLITRESCGCLDATRAGILVDGVAHAGSTTAATRVAEIARVVFGGPLTRRTAPAPTRASPAAPAVPTVEGWLRAVLRVLGDAASGGTPPPPEHLRAIADATAGLRPHPEALEQLIPVLRELGHDLADTVRRRPPTAPVPVVEVGAVRRPGATERSRVVRDTTTDLLVAVSAGCTQALLARSGQLERTISDQYELDLDLLHADAAGLRSLDWLPRGHRGPATLALWSDPGDGPHEEDRELEVVGTTVPTADARGLLGARLRSRAFPPPALTGPPGEAGGLSFVIPVTFEASSWGFLVIGGAVDTHATSAREKYDHWAALLAVALDREQRLTSLREQRAALSDAAERERALALDVRASAERYALAADAALEGTWDWDIATGVVFYSAAWKSLLGYRDDEIGTSLDEWTSRVHPDDAREVQVAITAQLAGADGPLVLEHRLRAADGSYPWVLCRAVAVTDDAGCRARLVGVLSDTSDAKQRELQLRSRVLVDPLTGAVHPDLFADRLASAVERVHRQAGYDCTVLAVEVARAASDVDVQAVRGGLLPGDALTVNGRELLLLLDGTDGRARSARVVSVRSVVGAEACVAVTSSLQGFADADAVLRETRTALTRERALAASRRRPG